MLPMIFKFLGGPIINKVVSTGVRYFEKRQEISEAKHTARLEIEAKKATADIDWDAATMETSKQGFMERRALDHLDNWCSNTCSSRNLNSTSSLL